MKAVLAHHCCKSRGFVTVLQVNAAVDDIAALAEGNAKLVAAARGRGTSLSVEDRRHAQSLIRNVAVSSMLRRWIRAGTCVRG